MYKKGQLLDTQVTLQHLLAFPMHLKLLYLGLVVLWPFKAMAFEDQDSVTEDDQDEDVDKSDIPVFTWDTEYHYLHHGLKERLIVKFPDGGPDDAALLEPNIQIAYDETMDDVDNCIFNGMLTNESDVPVSLNGCPLNYTFEVKVEIILMTNRGIHCSHEYFGAPQFFSAQLSLSFKQCFTDCV